MESNLTYDTVDTWLFNKIPGFKEYFLIIWDEDDREQKYFVMGELADFFIKNLDNLPLRETILRSITVIYDQEDSEMKQLVFAGFIEELSIKDIETRASIRTILYSPEIRSIFDSVFAYLK